MKSNLIYSILNVFVSTIFPILIFPYISRVLGVEGIGSYNFYNQSITYLTLFSSFGINIYGVREIGKYKTDILKRTQIAIELFMINFLNAIIFFTIIISFTINSSYSNDFYLIITLSITLLSNALSVEWYFVGMETQKYILIRSFIVKIISLFFIFLFVRSKEDLLTYVLIVILGLFIPSILNFIIFIKTISISTLNRLNLKQHLKFLFTIFLVEISFRYFGMVDTVILGIKEPKATVGYYSLSFSIFSIVCSFIRVSAVTMLPRASYYLKMNLMNEFGQLINNTIKFILFIGIPSSIGIFFWSDFIVLILGGESFKQSANILNYFSILVIITSLINMLVFQILYPLNQIKSIITSLFIGIIFNIFFNFLLIPLYSSKGVVISSIISHTLILLLLINSYKKLELSFFFSKEMIAYLYSGIILIITLIIFKNIFRINNIILQLIIGTISYLGALIIFKEQLFINQVLKWIKR